MSALIKIEEITKVYQLGKVTTKVLRGISLAVMPGEFVSIMGPSGTGKSTLMHILGLLDRPTAGIYQLEGQDVTGLSDNALSAIRNEKMGFVFQSFQLLDRATALKNVMLPMTYASKYPADARARARSALEKVRLDHRLDHRPGELSGGERQRVAIARALVQNPTLLFADEPTGNLDNRASYEIMDIFQELNNQGKTIVVVTHEPDIAQHTRRIIRLNYGRLTEDKLVVERLSAKEGIAAFNGDEADRAAT